MKQKDIAIIIIAAFFAGLISFFGSQALFASKPNRTMTAEKVDKITSEFTKPDTAVFNKNAINPTKLIQIGDSSNTKPF